MPLTGSFFTEENFRKIVEHAPIGIVIIDANQQWQMVNQRFCDIIGYKREELAGKTFIDITYPEDREKNLGLYQRMLSGEIEEYQFEKRYIHKVGRIIWVQLTVSGVRIGGAYSHLIALIQDIESNKKYQQAIENTNRELDTLIYKASHDLKSPISTLRGLAHLMKMEKPDLGKNKTFDHLELTIEKLRSQNEILLQLTQMSERIVRYQNVSLEEFFGTLIGNSDLKIGQVKFKGIKDVVLKSDPELLSIVFKNLIENCIRYSNPEELKVSISYENGSDRDKLTVHDNGYGIDPTIKDKIFDMFYKGSAHSIGSGLGLYVAKKAVEKLKGEIQFESENGKETIFRIFLPHS